MWQEQRSCSVFDFLLKRKEILRKKVKHKKLLSLHILIIFLRQKILRKQHIHKENPEKLPRGIENERLLSP